MALTVGIDGMGGLADMADMVFSMGVQGFTPLIDGLIVFGLILARYFLVAGGSYLLLYRPGATPQAIPQAPPQRPSAVSIRRDIVLSVLSAGVFALATLVLLAAHRHGLTRLYTEVPEPLGGLAYGLASYLLVLLLQDAWFYLTHRLVHLSALYPWMHRGHHRSRCPNPWTSFAFDPPEAAVQALFLLAVVALIPLHPITLIAVLTTMTVWAVVNHLGLDRLPTAFPHHWLGRWLIGPSHHALHHRRPAVHFGLYFTHLDRLFGSEDPAYVSSLGTAALGEPALSDPRAT
ncbi:sterol desaturase family protein [Cyanobium sp. ATX 6F1]|uniref:sterol desaturase family protein n=1 Tax=Cyanobium sp. ATX 6F1 TaxID=2823702 RepID=UPI0028F434EA|nr:sterol desaturase family protein [Cyanobium sp. ATX 6F1]